MAAEPHAVCVAAAQPNKANCTAVLHFPNTWGSIAGSAGGGGGGDSSSPRDPSPSFAFPADIPKNSPHVSHRQPSPRALWNATPATSAASRLRKHAASHAGIAPFHASATATDATNALSPAGSRYEPATPVWFHRLARYPSSQSEAPAATTAARINSGGASLTIPAAMSGPDAPRAMDRAFGIVAMSP